MPFSDLPPVQSGVTVGRATQAAVLQHAYGALDTAAILKAILIDQAAGRAAVVTSFGTEAAVLLHLVSEADPTTPVVFVDTGRHFGETKHYGRLLQERLELTNVRIAAPGRIELVAADPDEMLFADAPDKCCDLRKRSPLQTALSEFDCWVSGRKRYQSESRADTPVFEFDGRHIKVNPLADWARDDVQNYFETHDLPRHPLEEDGYLSIGCMPCTDRVRPGEDARAGRWRGLTKLECGIHSSPGADRTA